MNGKHTLKNLTRNIHQDFDPAALGNAEAYVALFLAMLVASDLCYECMPAAMVWFFVHSQVKRLFYMLLYYLTCMLEFIVVTKVKMKK